MNHKLSFVNARFWPVAVAAAVDRRLPANSVEKGGLGWSHLSSVQNTQDFDVAARNLKLIGSGTASDFNVRGLLSKADIARDIFNRVGQKRTFTVTEE
ncbi:MAG: hypothetical protein CVV16_08505 [Gammaproteobacteria bacterium HGW-Gammaproteobacteria-6]|nr:MAG: hypothetical protein CVV16_08505 [Gammaproteobacteria bacterium HGW-Gammaproteobacteria-6]